MALPASSSCLGWDAAQRFSLSLTLTSATAQAAARLAHPCAQIGGIGQTRLPDVADAYAIAS